MYRLVQWSVPAHALRYLYVHARARHMRACVVCVRVNVSGCVFACMPRVNVCVRAELVSRQRSSRLSNSWLNVTRQYSRLRPSDSITHGRRYKNINNSTDNNSSNNDDNTKNKPNNFVTVVTKCVCVCGRGEGGGGGGVRACERARLRL